MKYRKQRRSVAEQIYARVLILYPTDFRKEYASEMLQLFRDLNRSAKTTGRRIEVIRFWIHILMDTLTGISQQHFSGMKRNLGRIHPRQHLRRLCSTPSGVFTTVFACGIFSSAVWSLVSPVQFQSSVQIKTSKPIPLSEQHVIPPKNFRHISSESVLEPIVKNLRLVRKRTGEGSGRLPLNTAQTIALLQSHIHPQFVPNSNQLNVRLTGEDPRIVNELASQVARMYTSVSLNAFSESNPSLKVSASTVQALHSKRSNFVTGIFISVLVAICFVLLKNRRSIVPSVSLIKAS